MQLSHTIAIHSNSKRCAFRFNHTIMSSDMASPYVSLHINSAFQFVGRPCRVSASETSSDSDNECKDGADDDFHCCQIRNTDIEKQSETYRTTMDGVTALYRELKTEWDKTNPNLKKCGTVLDQLKVIIKISYNFQQKKLSKLFANHFF